VPDSLSITAATVDPGLLDLPWDLPLDTWPDDTIVALPKGISRHLVRFVHLSGYVVAVKETGEEIARSEYEMLRTLQRMDVPCVDPVAVITNRVSEDGEPLHPALVTRHLRFSLPYRALYSQTLRPETATRLVDALALLLVRLHIIGFYWGDVSLSNTLFRRDAGSFAAYLVDAETGKLYPGGLSNGQRENDLEVARVNIAGELLDLEAGGRLDENADAVDVSNRIVAQYRTLWKELTGTEQFDAKERWRINDRVERLNALGFDIEELSINTAAGGDQVRIQPKVVDAGHHQRRLLRLTGLDAGENQARRLRGTAAGSSTRRWSRTSGSPACSSPSSGRSRVTCAVGSNPPRSSTSCSSTAGSCPSRRSAPSPCPRPRPRTSTTCSATAATSAC
jgi:hypothetical protein